MGSKAIGYGLLAASIYAAGRLIVKRMEFAGVGEFVEGVDYESVNGAGTTNLALEQIRDKQSQLRQMPGQIQQMMDGQTAYITKASDRNQQTMPQHNYNGSGLSDYQQNEIKRAALRHGSEVLQGGGQYVREGNFGRPE